MPAVILIFPSNKYYAYACGVRVFAAVSHLCLCVSVRALLPRLLLVAVTQSVLVVIRRLDVVLLVVLGGASRLRHNASVGLHLTQRRAVAGVDHVSALVRLVHKPWAPAGHQLASQSFSQVLAACHRSQISLRTKKMRY